MVPKVSILEGVTVDFAYKYLFLMNSENDVAGIDVNMGCPKDYSVKVINLQYWCNLFIIHIFMQESLYAIVSIGLQMTTYYEIKGQMLFASQTRP